MRLITAAIVLCVCGILFTGIVIPANKEIEDIKEACAKKGGLTITTKSSKLICVKKESIIDIE